MNWNGDDDYDGGGNLFVLAVDWYKALLLELAKVEEKTVESSLSGVSEDDEYENTFALAGAMYEALLRELRLDDEMTEGTYSATGNGTVMTQSTAGTKGPSPEDKQAEIKSWISSVLAWRKPKDAKTSNRKDDEIKASSKMSWSNSFETKPSTRSEDKKADEEASDVYYPPVGVNKEKSKKNEPSEPSAVTNFLEEASLSIDKALINYDNKPPTPNDDGQVSLASKISSLISRKNKPQNWMTAEEIEEHRRLAEERDKQADINAYLKRNLIPMGFDLGCVLPLRGRHAEQIERGGQARRRGNGEIPHERALKGTDLGECRGARHVGQDRSACEFLF